MMSQIHILECIIENKKNEIFVRKYNHVLRDAIFKILDEIQVEFRNELNEK